MSSKFEYDPVPSNNKPKLSKSITVVSLITVVAIISVIFFTNRKNGSGQATIHNTLTAQEATKSQTPTRMATNTPSSTATQFTTSSPTSGISATIPPSQTPTSTYTPLPSRTPVPSRTATNTPNPLLAVTTLSASLFVAPSEDSYEITFINPDTTLTVLGRSANESWLFVRTPINEEGWVAVSRIDYTSDITELPITQEIMTPVSGGGGGSGNGSGGELSGLTFDFWNLLSAATCRGGSWTMPLFMEGHGGDGRYTYYINGQQVAGPLNGSYTYDHTGSGVSNVRITGRVTSGDGQSTETILFASAPDC